MKGEDVGVIPVVTEDPQKLAVIPGEDAYEFFEGRRKTKANAWVNLVTLKRFWLEGYFNCSIDVSIAHNPRPFIPLIAPTPLLLTVATEDTITPTDLQLAAFNEAREPKQLQLLPGDHFIVYHSPLFERNVSTQTEFLKKWVI